MSLPYPTQVRTLRGAGQGGRAVMERCAAVGTLSSTTPTNVPGTSSGPARYARVSAYCPWIAEATLAEVQCVDPLDEQAQEGIEMLKNSKKRNINMEKSEQYVAIFKNITVVRYKNY